VLVDASGDLSGEPARSIDESGQILGRLTEPLFPGPGRFRVELPIAPSASDVDLDNDGAPDPGVKVYALRVASNLIGDSYLQQLEQYANLASILKDIASGDILEGTILVHAPDGEQSFPAAPGADGIWFTGDDPTAPLPAGYTVVSMDREGSVTFDRSSEVAMSPLEAPASASPDFSDQGILESYGSLIDLLAERYAYTELRGLDWEGIRADYLSRVEEADADGDYSEYYFALTDLALSLGDGHVSVGAYGNVDAYQAGLERYTEQVEGNVGSSVIAVSDEERPEDGVGGRIVVLRVGEDTPASEAGWVPGTEILSVNGAPIADHLASRPLFQSGGTEQARLLQRTVVALSSPLGETITVGYRLPGSTDVLTATMVSGRYETGAPPETGETSTTPVAYEQVGDFAVLRWSDFIGYVLPKIYVLQEALAVVGDQPSAGVILDLRGNSGGWATLYQTMASHFFSKDEPMATHVFDWWRYDEEEGRHVRDYALDLFLSAPEEALAYTGPVAILIDGNCGSACEYFSQHLQVLGRATVIGQYVSKGAGGFIDRAKLPGGLDFTYTVGRTTFAGTEEPNLEAKGVTPDVWVPVTLETEQAKARGEDPVMDAAVRSLTEIVAQIGADSLPGKTWQWTQTGDVASGSVTTIENGVRYTLVFAENGDLVVRADCDEITGTYTLGEDDGILTIEIDEGAVTACGGASRGPQLVRDLNAARAFTFADGRLAIVSAGENGSVMLGFEPVSGD